MGLPCEPQPVQQCLGLGDPAGHDNASSRPGTGREGVSWSPRSGSAPRPSRVPRGAARSPAGRNRGCRSTSISCLSTRIPNASSFSTTRRGSWPPQVSLPVQGTAAADAVVTARQLKDLVNAGAPHTTITLRLEWNTAGARLLLILDPGTVPAERYRTLSIRVGQSTEANNAANRDQDFTLEVSSGSRTAAIPRQQPASAAVSRRGLRRRQDCDADAAPPHAAARRSGRRTARSPINRSAVRRSGDAVSSMWATCNCQTDSL